MFHFIKPRDRCAESAVRGCVHAVSRSLVELAAEQTFPIAVDILRPPTFANLRDHLRKHPNHYHILHFDGHGAYHTITAGVLKDVAGLRGGATKMFITSRSPEVWLGPTNAGKPVSLGGLDGEDWWEFANTIIVRDFGLKRDRKDAAIATRMEFLKGHPHGTA